MDAGTDDEQGAGETDHDRRDPARADPLPEEQDREYRGEQGRGERERRHQHHRGDAERVEEQEHRDHVERRTRTVQAEAPGAERAPAVGDEDRREHQEPEEIAKERRLEGVDGLRDVTHSDVHRAEEHAREHHEADPLERVRGGSRVTGRLAPAHLLRLENESPEAQGDTYSTRVQTTVFPSSETPM